MIAVVCMLVPTLSVTFCLPFRLFCRTVIALGHYSDETHPHDDVHY